MIQQINFECVMLLRWNRSALAPTREVIRGSESRTAPATARVFTHRPIHD